ncbi:MAG TPA: twin-arginine translocase TatA/TatE family subunit [Actinomycetes bacterium]|jgi:sec-independent protein translocase protein TatB|nr:twin-arginine translocase TatA/TatE family subunit [Actinomycetes bacterium]
MFNVGLGEIAAIVLVTLLLFGPERLPEMARQAGRFLGRLRLITQDALDQLKEETDLKDLNLPDLRIGSLRSQARDYVRELMDVEGQMAELEREREQLKAALDAEQDGQEGSGAPRPPEGSEEPRTGTPVDRQGGNTGPPPVDPDAT